MKKNHHRTSIGFYSPEKLTVNNFADNVELEEVGRRGGGRKMDARLRVLMGRGNRGQEKQEMPQSFHSSAIMNNSEASINSVVNNYFIIKSSLLRPNSELNNYHHSNSSHHHRNPTRL